jgi:peptidoglycan/LPS O-acetylase OafA/YrhL
VSEDIEHFPDICSCLSSKRHLQKTENMADSEDSSSQRLAWLEGIRIFAAIAILLYHAQLLITDYAFAPSPTGLVDNLRLIATAGDRFGGSLITQILSFLAWFGFQFVDVFVLLSGFSLVLSLKGRPLELGHFLRHRVLRILLPFWTVVLLSYPTLWAIGVATNSYKPDPWSIFAGITFPLLFDYAGNLLLLTSGPWWFLPLILSFSLVFPFLWYLLQRWGCRNLLLVSCFLTLGYRTLAVYQFGGHPTYVTLDTPTDWLPFLPFLAKLSTFVLGMVVAQAYRYGRGPVFWHPRSALLIGVLFYMLGFVSQFYKLGWVVAELLLPIGLVLCSMVLFRALASLRHLSILMLRLGSHSYSYFLIHNFVADRTIRLVIHDNLSLYSLLLPIMVVGTLMLSALVDATTPLLQRFLAAAIQDIDYVLTIAPPIRRRLWSPQIGDRVCYNDQKGWIVLKVEQLLDDKEFYLCQISDGHRTMWLSEEDLELDNSHPPDRSGNSKMNSARP